MRAFLDISPQFARIPLAVVYMKAGVTYAKSQVLYFNQINRFRKKRFIPNEHSLNVIYNE